MMTAKVKEVISLDGTRRRMAVSVVSPASSLSASVAIAAIGLAFRDSVTTFLVVWFVSFFALSVVRILAWHAKGSQVGPRPEPVVVSEGVGPDLPRLRDEPSLIQGMLSGYQPSVRKEIKK